MSVHRLSLASSKPSLEEWVATCIKRFFTAEATEPSAAAYPVPWHIEARDEHGDIVLENRSEHTLRSVRFTLAGDGMLGLTLPQSVNPGERVTATVRGVLDSVGEPMDPTAMLVVRWLEPDGTELLWPITW